ncbi:MAG: hypothetical protein WD875_06160 [Pirellulales bacterium]
MPYDNAKAALATASATSTTVGTRQLTALRQCLVVSSHPQRCESLREAAIEGGWLPIVFADAELAWDESRRSVMPLVVVDVHDAADRPAVACRQLVERLSRESGRLLAVCGGDAMPPQDEIWARQLGAWMVMPGIVDAHDVASVYEEAGKVIERSEAAAIPSIPHARRGPARHGTRRRAR